MPQIVLLAVAAAWAAVLIPPLLRSRTENRPNSSVTDFRRQLSTLQRAVPTRTMVPVRTIGRPLTQAPQTRSAMHGHPGQVHRAQAPQGRSPMSEASLERRPEPGYQHHRQVHLHRVNHREVVRRRRTNVLYALVLSVGVTAFLAATTKSSLMVYTFAFSFVALCGYCYKLAQLRAQELDRQVSDHSWSHAA